MKFDRAARDAFLPHRRMRGLVAALREVCDDLAHRNALDRLRDARGGSKIANRAADQSARGELILRVRRDCIGAMSDGR
jgi:hypothetical protein